MRSRLPSVYLQTLPHPIRLKVYLDSFLGNFDCSRHLNHDPVSFIHRYKNPRDQEVAGLLASSLAYGRVDKILEFLERLFRILGPSPYEFVIQFDPHRDREKFRSLVYRFHRGRHIACFIHLSGQVLRAYDSLEQLFLQSYGGQNSDFEKALAQFIKKIFGGDVKPFYPSGRLPKDSPVRFFLPSPQDGSTCKRLNLFFRWMVRGPDAVDLGLWKNVSPAHLIIPLDTHVARICRYLGLADRARISHHITKSDEKCALANPSWKMARQITENLRLLDPQDPIKYDFALCHLGISGDCPSRPDWAKCRPCQLRPVCRCWSAPT